MTEITSRYRNIYVKFGLNYDVTTVTFVATYDGFSQTIESNTKVNQVTTPPNQMTITDISLQNTTQPNQMTITNIT